MSELEDNVAVVVIIVARKVIEDWLSEACRLLFHGKVAEYHLKYIFVVVINLPVLSLNQGLISIEREFCVWIVDLAIDYALSIGLFRCQLQL